MKQMQVQSLGQEDPLKKEMAAHSSILTWKSPWTEEPGGVQSTEPQSWTWLSNSLNWRYTVLGVIYQFTNWLKWRSRDLSSFHLLIAVFGGVGASQGVGAGAAPQGWAELLVAVSSLLAEPGPWVHGVQSLRHLASVLVIPRLSCSPACGIFPTQGSNLRPCIGM